jgi:hypothetical protein
MPVTAPPTKIVTKITANQVGTVAMSPEKEADCSSLAHAAADSLICASGFFTTKDCCFIP